MLEVGRVVKVKGGSATVEFERKTACDKCGMCAFKKDDMFVKCTLNNKFNARVGDLVTVHMGKNYVLTAAIIAYLMPLVIAGISLACTFMLADYIQFIAVVLSLVVGFTIAALLDKYVIRKKEGFRPTMMGIIDPDKLKKTKLTNDMDEVELANLQIENNVIAADGSEIVSQDKSQDSETCEDKSTNVDMSQDESTNVDESQDEVLSQEESDTPNN